MIRKIPGILFVLMAFSLISAEPEDLNAPPIVTADAWAIVDGSTGTLLWENEGRKPRKTASITKVMAALVVLSLAEKNPAVFEEVITFSEAADRTGGSTSSVQAGEKVTVSEALYGLMLPSGNDMGNALAEHFSPRLEPPSAEMLAEGLDNPVHAKRVNFIAEMNRLAGRFGMDSTFYRIAYGDGGTATQQTSSAVDICRLGFQAMADERLRKIVGTRSYTGTVRQIDGSVRKQVWENTNDLLKLERGYDGIKTGFTRSAGRCLLASGRREDRHLIVVVLGSDSAGARNADVRNLFRWAWRNIESGRD